MKWMPSRAPRTRVLPAAATGAQAIGTLATGSLAVAAVAVGALALGALAVGRLFVGRARIRHLEIDELVVRRIRVVDRISLPPPERGEDVPGTDSTFIDAADVPRP